MYELNTPSYNESGKARVMSSVCLPTHFFPHRTLKPIRNLQASLIISSGNFCSKVLLL